MPGIIDLILAPFIYAYYIFSIFVFLFTGIDIWSVLGIEGQGI